MAIPFTVFEKYLQVMNGSPSGQEIKSMELFDHILESQSRNRCDVTFAIRSIALYNRTKQ